MARTTLSQAISAYNALVATHGQDGAYNLIQERIANDSRFSGYNTGAVDQEMETLTRAADYQTGNVTPQPDNTSLLASLLGIK